MTYYRTQIVDGIKIFYREAGDRKNPTLLLLHGFPASSFMYRDLIEQLKDRFHLIAPDYPGFGYSDAPSVGAFTYTFDRLADVIDAFTAQLGIERYGLYLQDFGGPVGFRLASRHPDKVTFLVIQNANAYEEGLPDDFWAPARALWNDPSPENFDKIRNAAISDEALEWNYTHGVADVERVNPDNWVLQRALLARPGNKEIMLALLYDYRTNLDRYPEWHAYFEAHQPPTLIVWGKHDVVFPESGAHPYRRHLKQLDFHLLETGHFALEDQSAEIAAHIKRFAENAVSA
ncbi:MULTISPECIES: alpha/beta hydrolase [Burkholderia]|uniref:alpha/beta fold hydrolase n=1 Tax=Burkholderia TaxID=32008 RepID=UPI0003280022|nr:MULTISPECIES: alpha/beta hydrolase [Burkholderia]AGK51772.1 alpha/beta hydrolase fold family protein [Burkholderia thailandensis MSMB121]ATF33806.1 alpha/beta hydrolase [Burkholderia thailandensis]KST71887.1 alpha/beta hydrolase [Burkholderia humptydooensis]KVN06773.1 alpha/beta hydrolase [Burkholderia sp. MSMB1552]KWZ50005.1 alpha/beta hydrolase [Burkholderia sp. MSMB1588]